MENQTPSYKYDADASTVENLTAFYKAIKKEHIFIRGRGDLEMQCLDMQIMSKEMCRIFYMDGQNRIIKTREFFGGIGHCTIYPRDVFYTAMECDADTIAMVHNHPGGSQKPSDADWKLTHRIKRIGDDLGINLIDHCIMYGEGIVSLRANSRW